MSILFPLDNNDKGHLKRLNENKPLVFALKKLFLNVCISELPSNEAITKITKAFHELSVIKPENQREVGRENLV